MKRIITKGILAVVAVLALNLIPSNTANAHAVQLTYCANCGSTLRLWIEHWHSTEAVTSTTMTISLTVGGVTTTTTGSPLTNIQNVPIANLPGCNQPPTVFASCPTRANTYNDWVNFDFLGVPCGVPVVITVISGSTAFTMDCGGMYPASTPTFTIPCTVNKPTSSFIPPPAVCLGVPMTFTDNSTGGNPTLIYQWNFGDSTAYSTAQNPTHTYTTPGTYCVTLRTKKTVGGCEDDTVICVVVEDQPVANFSSAPKCSGYSTPFTDLSTITSGTITQWSWNFGDGSPLGTTQNPTHIYTTCGNYNVKLITTSQGGCIDSTTIPVVIPCSPTANFGFDTVCFGNPTSFTDLTTLPGGAIAAWQWNFGGQGTSGVQNPQFTFGTVGTHNVTLTVTSSDGCVDSISRAVVISATPAAVFSAPDVCDGSITPFTDLSTATVGTPTLWQWNFNGQGTSALQHPSFQFTGTGPHSVKLVVGTGPTCKDSVTVVVNVNDMPVALFASNDECYGIPIGFTDNSTIAAGSITGYSWNFNPGNSTQQNPTNNYGQPGLYNVTLIVTSDKGCVDSITNPVNVFPQPVVGFTRNQVCDGAAMQFTDLTTMVGGGNPNLVWDFAGFGNSAAQSPSFTFPSCGAHTVKLIASDPQGCIDSVSKTVYVNCNPVVDFTGDVLSGCAPVCPNFTNLTTIAGGNIATWAWNFGDGSSSGSQSPSHCYENNGLSLLTHDVSLTATSDSGCVTSLTKPSYVSVFPWPIANFNPEPDIVKISDPEIHFNNWSQGAATWMWDFGDATTDPNYSPTHMYKDTGSYIVWLTIENQWGCRDSIWKTVRVDPEYFIYIPNAFTPTNDGSNDLWSAKFWGVEEATTMVFDRWGELLWEGHQLDSKWDGKFKGQPAKQDVYVYLVRVKTVLGEEKEYRGKVTLLK